MIDWSKHFDRIYCFHFLGNGKKRLDDIKAELSRVGILDSGIFQFVYTSPDPWEKRMWENDPRVRLCYGFKVGMMNLALATARSYREALAFGYRRCLFLENDIRFLKDFDEIEATLAATPADFDVVQYDKFLPWQMTNEQYARMVGDHRINDRFFRNDGNPLYSGACYRLNESGMKKILGYLENTRPEPPDGLFAVKAGTTNACADRNMAVQVFYGDAMAADYFRGRGNTHHKAYAPMKLDYSLYAVPDGYGRDANEMIS